LTININLKKNGCYGEILKLQENIINGINVTENIEKGIYKYSKDQFHFSVINFENYKKGGVPIDKFKELNYHHIAKINSLLQKFDGYTISDKTVQSGYIYTGCNLQSIAIQVFPSIQLCQLFDDICYQMNKGTELGLAKIKDNRYNRFAVNIVRFFRELTFNEKESISRSIDDFNITCENNRKIGEKIFFEFEIEYISFVVSDNWLSNQYPEQSFIKLA